ncbi:hypothetical protein F2Q70_00044848 [Brassica cretica]|uniref:Uncharacterized protein n=1 Tax=Brassica cretica TaxID=69181 RepID=A0A8S9KFS8_BRACR|nr:hypothetical protein F2Q70_00044848 [Brassica cretica]
MFSSHGDKRSSDVEMGEATSPAPIPTSPVEAPACVADHLSFRERLVRRQAEKEQVVTSRDAGTLAGSVVPDASALPAGSSTTPILFEDKERADDSMPPPPARKVIVLALRAPSVVLVAQPKGRQRKFTKGSDGESSQQGDLSIASGLRGKFMSLIDGMISECGSETSRLAGELLELQGRWSETEAMLTAVKDSHSVRVSKLEVAIGELERDLGKTASSFLKEKKTRKAKSLEVRRLQRQIEGDAGLASRGIREAKIFAFLGSLECIRNRDLALATIEGGMAVVQSFQSETPPTLEAEEARLAADSMRPPPARKEIVLALRAPSVVPIAQPKGRKRMFTKGGDGESSQQWVPNFLLVLQFMSLIDGMISECGSKTSRLAGELLELHGRWSETEAMLTAVKDYHSVKVSKLEVAIGELERDLGKTASSLLKEKKARKAKSLEVCRLQRQIEGDVGLASHGIREAKDALRSEFQACLAKISTFLGSLECIRNRDLALATIEGGMAVVQSFQSETPPTLEAEEARLSGCKGYLAVVDGDFDLILADLKSACFLPTCSEGPEGKDPVLGEGGGNAAPGLDEATGEEGPLVRRQAKKDQVRAGAEFPSSSALAIAPGHGTKVVTPRDTGTLAGSVVPDALTLPAGSSTTPILVEDKERAADSMPPPPAKKEIVLALRAPSVVPVSQPKGRKRKFTKGGDGESSQQGDSSIASGLRGKFMLLIDGMISECSSETSRLAGELLELQGRWSETEAMLTAVKDSHSVKVSKLEVAIGELERDLGKTASSLLKEKKARKAKSSEISAILGSLDCIRNRDLAIATIEGGMAVVQSFQSETPPTLEARLSDCKGDLAVADGDFDLILADLKSAGFLPTCSDGPEGKDPVLGEGGGDAAPGLDEATGEEGA